MLNRRKTSPTPSADSAPPTHGSTARRRAAEPIAAQSPAAAPVSASAESAGPARDRSQGKKGPTPRRRDQEAARRRPIVPEDRKAAKKADREAAAAERMRQRLAFETGDERGLPARDQGPQRRWVRDYVDARTGLGEWLMPVVFAYVLLMFVPGSGFRLALMLSLYAIVGVVIAESFFVANRIKKGLTARFGTPEPGVRMYGVMRALQFRRLRLPKPQVKRGRFPG